MRSHGQEVDDAVDTPPTVAKESPFAIRGNTRTVRVWHLKESPVEKKAEEQRQTALKHEEAARKEAEMEHLRALYTVSSAELTASEQKWRVFLASRSREGAAQDFVSSWRDSVPLAPKKVDVVGEARFSKLVPAQHDKCALCEAMEIILMDASLSEYEQEWYIRRLVHRDPKRVISPPTGEVPAPGVHGEWTFEDLISASAWGHVQASSAQKESVVRNESLFVNMVDTADLMGVTPAANRMHYELSQAITKFLVKGAGLLSNNEIVDYLTNNKALRQHSEAVLQRVAVYRANKEAAQLALVAANSDNRLSVNDIEKASTAKADALELERDLVMLETRQQANRAGIELARKGYSMLKHNDIFCELRRSQKAAGYYHHQRVGREDREDYGGWFTDAKNDDVEVARPTRTKCRTGSSFARESTSERLQRVQRVSQGCEAVTASKGPTPPLTQAQPLEAQAGGPSKYFKPMQESGKHTRKQDDNASISTDDNPFNLEQALTAVSGPVGAAGSSTESATTPSPTSKVKKDSKVEALLKEDGVSLKDFAAEPDQQKSTGLRKLSVSTGLSSRPRWK